MRKRTRQLAFGGAIVLFRLSAGQVEPEYLARGRTRALLKRKGLGPRRRVRRGYRFCVRSRR